MFLLSRLVGIYQKRNLPNPATTRWFWKVSPASHSGEKWKKVATGREFFGPGSVFRRHRSAARALVYYICAMRLAQAMDMARKTRAAGRHCSMGRHQTAREPIQPCALSLRTPHYHEPSTLSSPSLYCACTSARVADPAARRSHLQTGHWRRVCGCRPCCCLSRLCEANQRSRHGAQITWLSSAQPSADATPLFCPKQRSSWWLQRLMQHCSLIRDAGPPSPPSSALLTATAAASAGRSALAPAHIHNSHRSAEHVCAGRRAGVVRGTRNAP